MTHKTKTLPMVLLNGVGHTAMNRFTQVFIQKQITLNLICWYQRKLKLIDYFASTDKNTSATPPELSNYSSVISFFGLIGFILSSMWKEKFMLK